MAILGDLGPPQLACLRSWKRHGFHTIFVHVSTTSGNGLIRRFVDGYLHIPEDQLRTEARERQLINFLRSQGCDGLTCVSDALALWLRRLADRSDFPCNVWVAPTATMKLLESKARQQELAERCGFDTLPTYLYAKSDDCDIPDNAFPLVARPDSPASVSTVFKAELLRDMEALHRFAASLREIRNPLVLQPYKKGPSLLIHGFRCLDGARQGVVASAVVLRSGGLAVRICPVPVDADLAQKCLAFASQVGMVGCFHFDFVLDDKERRVYFLEMNARFGGTTAKVYAMGYDEPALLPYCHGAAEPNSIVTDPDRLSASVNRQALLKLLLQALNGKVSPFDYPLTPLSVLHEACRASFDRDEVIRLMSPLSTAAYFVNGVMGRLF